MTKAASVNTSSTIASTAARPWSCAAPTTAKKMSVDSTLKLPPITSGLAKSAMLSMNEIRKALASPGRINGQVTVRNVRQRLARRVCDASSMLGLTALQHADQDQEGDRREGQHLRDGDAGHAVDPAAARNAEMHRHQIGDDAGAAEQQDQRQADDEGRRDDRQDRQAAQQPFHRQLGAQRNQRQGQAERRAEEADEDCDRHRVPRHAAGPFAIEAAQAPDRLALNIFSMNSAGTKLPSLSLMAEVRIDSSG